MSLKVKGTAYYFSQFGGEQPIPPEFVAAMQRSEKVQPVPNEIGPDALGDTVVESRVVTDQTGERMLHTVGKIAGNITLRGTNTDNEGQPVQVTRVLHPTGTQPDVPSATTKVSVADLGNGWSIQESSVEGTYVDGVFTPGIFSGNLFKIEIPEVIPLKFRAIVPILEDDETIEGTAQMPTLGTGDLMQSQEQIDEFRVRLMRSYRDLSGLPKSLVSEDTSEPKQVVTITETLQLATATVATPTATRTVTVENLGDGTVLQTTRDVPSVFPQTEYGTERPDVTPEDFRALLALTSVSISGAGSASTPTLSTGDVEARDEQLTLFTHRSTVANRALPSSGAQFINEEVREGLPVTVTRTIATGGQNISPDYLTLDGSQMKFLGDGRSVMEKLTVAGYTVRPGQTNNQQLGIPQSYSIQKVSNARAETYVGTPLVDIEPVDEARSILKDISVNSAEAAVLAAYMVSYGATIDAIEFPPVLTALTIEWQVQVGKGDNTETGEASLSGNGTLQLELPESAQASATAIPNVVATIQNLYARNVIATDLVFFVVDNTTVAAILARAGAKPWPIFQPVERAVTCKGEKVTVRANANARMAISLSPYGNSTALSSGSGGDSDNECISRVVVIPPTIHGAISVGGVAEVPGAGGLPSVVPKGGYTNFPPKTALTSLTSNTSIQIEVSAAAKADLLAPAAEAQRTVKLTANGSVSPSSFGATPGISAIPATGVYAYRVTTEPYRPGWTMVRVRVVDFALLVAHTGGTLEYTADTMTATGGTMLGAPGDADTPTAVATLPYIDVTDTTLAPPPTYTPPIQLPNSSPGGSGGGVDTGSTAASPIIVTQPASVTVAAGASATFAVVATGIGLTYQWYLGTPGSGVLLNGATGSTYIVMSVAADEAGTYYVVVTNSAASVTSVGANLNGNSATVPPPDPQITQQPVSIVYSVPPMVPGIFFYQINTYTFSVAATGTPDLTYQWYCRNVGSTTNVLLVGETNPTLSLTPSSTGGPSLLAPGFHIPGYYHVVVKNGTGVTATSDEVEISSRTELPSVAFLRPLSGVGTAPNGKVVRLVIGLGHVYDTDMVFAITSNGYGTFTADSAGTVLRSTITIPAGSLGGSANKYGVVFASSVDQQLFYIADNDDFGDNAGDNGMAKFGVVQFNGVATVNAGTSTEAVLKVQVIATLQNGTYPNY